MKKLLLVCVLSASLFSCSLLQRRGGAGPEDDGEAASSAATETPADPNGPLFTKDGQEISGNAAHESGAAGSAAGESEVSRLTTKVAALETKVDVLTANLERVQAQKSQPVIQAEPQKNLAAPVDEMTSIEDQEKPSQVSAAPARPARLPSIPKDSVAEEAPAAKPSTGAEREFRAGMQLFQNGQNLEAASRFALMAKKFPHHMLAAHALYWAGESAARAQQWSIAMESWSELEKKYPRSAYMPEALAGLAKAYESQGDATKAKYYRTVLLRAFPKSPIAMKSGSEPTSIDAAPAKRISRSSVGPAPSESGQEEPAPVFEEDSGGAPASTGTGGEPPTETQ